MRLYWDHEKDIISLKINEVFNKAINIISTRQNILSAIASVYDLVGYLHQIVIKLKILFPKICKSNIGWDDDIAVLVNKWKEIVTSLTSSETISFGRCFCPYDSSNPINVTYMVFLMRQCLLLKFLFRNQEKFHWTKRLQFPGLNLWEMLYYQA